MKSIDGKPKTIAIRPFTLPSSPLSQTNEEETLALKRAQEKATKELEEAKQFATRLREEAEKEAMQIREAIEREKEAARAEIEAAIENGRQEGYKEGFAQGQIDGKNTYEETIIKAQQIVRLAEREYEKTIESAEHVIIELATELARRVIGKRVTEDETIWTSMLEQVMTEVREHEDVKLYVHPDWYEHTVQQKQELEQLLSRTEKLFIYPDAGLEENGCIVETRYGRIDATIDRQLLELKKQLLQKLEEGRSEGETSH